LLIGAAQIGLDESENAIRLRTHVLVPHFEIARRAEHIPSVAYDAAHLEIPRVGVLQVGWIRRDLPGIAVRKTVGSREGDRAYRIIQAGSHMGAPQGGGNRMARQMDDLRMRKGVDQERQD
jgi:hypothetical protein